MKISTPGSAEEWMRGVNKRLSAQERRGGAFSGVVVERVVGDEVITTYAPVIPSQPIVEQKPGAVAITWDGLGVGDEAMPPNLATIAVHRSNTSVDFEPDDTTLVGNLNGPGTITYTDQPYDEVFYYRFVMHNTDGEISGPSTAAAAVANRVGGTDLTADSIDGKLITGATIQTGTSGGRAVLRPGMSQYYNLGSHVIEMYSGNAAEAFPAEMVCISDGPNPGDNVSLLIGSPVKSGTGNRAQIQMFSEDADTYSGVLIGASTSRLDSRVLTTVSSNYDNGTIHLKVDGPGNRIYVTQQGIDVDHAWVGVGSGNYAGSWTHFTGTGYVPGVRWKYTHDGMVKVELAMTCPVASGANPFVLNAGHGMPIPPTYYGEGQVRYIGAAGGYTMQPFIMVPANGGANAGKWQLLHPTSQTVTVIAGCFEYKYV